VKSSDLIPRSSFSVYTINLKGRYGRDREEAVQKLLKSSYPLSLKDTHIIIRRNGKGGNYLVFVFKKQEKKDPLTNSVLLAPRLAAKTKGKQYLVLETGGLREYITLENGAFLSSVLRDCEASITSQTADVLGPDCRAAVYSGRALEEKIRGIPRESCSCRPGAINSVKRRRVLLAAAAAAVSIFCGVSLQRYHAAVMAEQEAEAAEARLSRERQLLEKAEREKLASLEDAYRELREARGAGIYESIAVIASCLPYGTRIESAHIDTKGFRMEALSSGSLAILRNLENHSRIASCELSNILWNNGRERGQFSGTVTIPTSEAPQDFSLSKRIAWYESHLASFNGKELSGASGAGEEVLELLQNYGAQVKRIRYRGEGGVSLECTFESSPYALIRILYKTNEADFPLNAVSLDTRTQSNRVESTLVFEARLRPAGKTGGETEPDTAQIAAFYRGGGEPQTAPPRAAAFSGFVQTAPQETVPEPPRGPGNYLGYIELAGGTRTSYVKDSGTGEVRRADDN
jgi:hypothetical protein